MSIVEEFLDNIPELHSWDGGVTWNKGGFSRLELEIIYNTIVQEIGLNAVVAETGAGNSTLAMLLAEPARLTSIAPDAELFHRINSACNSIGINAAPLDNVEARSEDALPDFAKELEQSDCELDFCLIDGGHGWPTVFVDFCYFNRVLKVGGFLMIDDTQLFSVEELSNFLIEDPCFEVHTVMRKSILFRKTRSLRYLPDFGAQPYIMRKSKAKKGKVAKFLKKLPKI